MNPFMVINLMIYALVSASGLMLIKASMSKLLVVNFRQAIGVVFNWSFASGFTVYLLGFLYWLYLLSQYELSKAFPIASGLVMLFTVVLSSIFLKERLLPVNILGIVLMQMSIVLIHYGR